MSEPENPPPSAWSAHLLETYRGLITLAVEVLKSIMIINGAAAIAVLTYFGNIASHSSPEHPSHIAAGLLRWALMFYTFAMVLASGAWISAYLTQLSIYEDELVRGAPVPTGERYASRLWATVGLVMGAVVFFWIGSWTAARAIFRSSGLAPGTSKAVETGG